MPATRWSSHKDIAAKALRKLAGPHVPASLTKLEQAVKRAHAAYDKAETAAARTPAHGRQPPAEPVDMATTDEDARRGGVAARARARADPPPERGTPSGGRAGGGRSARAPGAGHATPRSTDDARRHRTATSAHRRRARRTPPGRPRNPRLCGAFMGAAGFEPATSACEAIPPRLRLQLVCRAKAVFQGRCERR